MTVMVNEWANCMQYFFLKSNTREKHNNKITLTTLCPSKYKSMPHPTLAASFAMDRTDAPPIVLIFVSWRLTVLHVPTSQPPFVDQTQQAIPYFLYASRLHIPSNTCLCESQQKTVRTEIVRQASLIHDDVAIKTQTRGEAAQWRTWEFDYHQ